MFSLSEELVSIATGKEGPKYNNAEGILIIGEDKYFFVETDRIDMIRGLMFEDVKILESLTFKQLLPLLPGMVR